MVQLLGFKARQKKEQEMICETCGKEIKESDLHHKYEDVVECDECRQYMLHDIGRTG